MAASLDSTETSLWSILNNLNCGIVTMLLKDSRHPLMQWANDGFYKLTGSSPTAFMDNSLIGDPSHVIHPDDFPWVYTALTDHIKSKEPLDIVYRVLHKSGSVIWLHVTSSVIGEKDGSPLVINIMEDVTAQIELQHKMQWERERFKAISALSNEILFEYRVDEDTIFHIGGNFEEVLGPHRAVIRNYRNFIREESFVCPEDVATVEAIISDLDDQLKAAPQPSAAADQSSVSCPLDNSWAQQIGKRSAEFRLKMANGEYQWYRALYSSKTDFNGRNVVIGKLLNIHETQLQISRLKERSSTDSLTSLLNRGAAEEAVRLRLKDHSVGWILFLIDIDEFKVINDTYGHLRGDEAIKALAACLRQNCRQEDIVARIGGDEFLIMMQGTFSPELTRQSAYSFWERLQESLTQLGLGFSLTISAGAALTSQHGSVYALLFDSADEALYISKRCGRNCLTFAR